MLQFERSVASLYLINQGLGVPSSYLGPSSPAPHPGVSGCPLYGVSTSPPYGVAAAAAGVDALYAFPFAAKPEAEGVGAAAGVGASYAARAFRGSLEAVFEEVW